MLLKKLDRYIDAIKIEEKVSLSGLNITELMDKLSTMDREERKKMLSGLDEITLENIKKLEEGGLV
jgi:hypothetical protein